MVKIVKLETAVDSTSLYLLAAIKDQTTYIVHGPSSSLNPELPLTVFTSQKTSLEADLDVWHQQLGHVNVQSISKLLKKGMVDGMAISNSKETHKDKCIPCLEGKQHHAVIPLWTGYRYFDTFIDGHSHHLIVKLIKLKNEVPKLTKEYLKRAEAEMGKHVNYFRSDGGGEYRSTVLQDYCKSKGIHHEMTNVYTPQENSVSKRMNHTLVEMAHAMLFDTGLPNAYWGDAILYAMHVLNCVPTHAIANGLTLHEAFTGNRSSVAHLRIFGCKAHVHIPDQKWRKLNTKSIKCIFLGFAENQKAYVCMHHPSSCILETQDVVFDKGSANALSRMKIDDSNLNVEEMKWSVAGTGPEAIGGTQDIPDEDGKTTKGDQPPDGVSINGEPSEMVSNDGNALVHAPDLSDCTRSPPDVESRC